jgi:hypothetical protein
MIDVALADPTPHNLEPLFLYTDRLWAGMDQETKELLENAILTGGTSAQINAMEERRERIHTMS